MEVLVPFSGFYGSEHEEALDWAMGQLYEGGKDLSVNWRGVYQAYGREYTEAVQRVFEESVGVPLPLVFKEIVSPREYNFTTDRCFAELDKAVLPALYAKADKDKLALLVEERFTSRSGFISYYSNDLEQWGPVEEWDHNQVGTLLEHLLLEYAYPGDLVDIVNDLSSSGVLEEILFSALDDESKKIVQEVTCD